MTEAHDKKGVDLAEGQDPTAITSPGVTSLPVQPASFAPRNWAELQEISAQLASSNHTPKQFRGNPADTLVAILMGLELGLNPVTALQNIAVVEGKPTVYGDIVLGLVRRSPDWVEAAYQEWFELDGERIVDPYELDGEVKDWPNNLRAVCVVQRCGGHPRTESFSVGRARQAGLWMRQSSQGGKMPWSTYPADMLMWRARARAIRPLFADVLKGCAIYEDRQGSQERTEREINPGGSGENRAPAPAQLSRSEAVLEKGRLQHDLLESVSSALSAAKTVAELKAVGESQDWRDLKGSNRTEARGRYAVRLSEIKEAAKGVEQKEGAS